MLLRDSLRADLEEKIRRLEEDRHNIDFTTGKVTGNSFCRLPYFDIISIFFTKKPEKSLKLYHKCVNLCPVGIMPDSKVFFFFFLIQKLTCTIRLSFNLNPFFFTF